MSWRKLRWWLLGAAAYLLFLGLTAPASLVTDRVAQHLPQLSLNGVDGTLLSGSAAEVLYQGVSLGAVQWHFDWRAPFSATLGYRVHVQAEDRLLDGRVDVGFGRLYLRGLEGRVPFSALDRWLPLPPRSLEGSVGLHLQQLTLKSGHLASVQGSLDLDQLLLKWPAAAMLGSFRVDLSPGADGIQAAAADVASPFKLKADLSLSADGAYHLKGTLAARDPGDAASRNLLSGLGTPDSTGQYPFDFQGHL